MRMLISNRYARTSTSIVSPTWRLCGFMSTSVEDTSKLQTTSPSSTLPPDQRLTITESIYGPSYPKYKQRFKNKVTMSYSRVKRQGTNRAMALIKAMDEAIKNAKSQDELITVDLKEIAEKKRQEQMVKVMSCFPTSATSGVPENAELIDSGTIVQTKKTKQTKQPEQPEQFEQFEQPEQFEQFEQPEQPVKPKEPVMKLNPTKKVEKTKDLLYHPKSSITGVFKLWAGAPVALFFDTKLSINFLLKKMYQKYELNADETFHLRQNQKDWIKIILASICIYFYPPSLLGTFILPFVQPSMLPSFLTTVASKVYIYI
ncbi:hypothetical protein HMI55_005894 [Coelomomyces lativittatus]|nr:hypothetical protein HMI55_005894 [Coelomomyces lativittatus]